MRTFGCLVQLQREILDKFLLPAKTALALVFLGPLWLVMYAHGLCTTTFPIEAIVLPRLLRFVVRALWLLLHVAVWGSPHIFAALVLGQLWWAIGYSLLEWRLASYRPTDTFFLGCEAH